MAILTSCWCQDLLLLGLSLAAVAYMYLTRTFSYWKKRGVPYVEPELLFGNIRDNVMVKLSIGELYQQLYNRLDGHLYGGFFKFRQPCLLIRDAELVKSVLVKDFSCFHDNDFHVTVEDDALLGRNPFCQTGDGWKRVRSQLTPAFTTAKVRPLFPLINEVCASLKTYLDTETAGLDGLEAKEIAAKFTTDVVATCTFGLNGNSFTDPNAQFRAMGKRILQPSFWKNVEHMCIILTPSLARIFNLKFFDNTVATFFRTVVNDAMSYRSRNNVTRNDFLQLLMQLKFKGHVEDDATEGVKHGEFTDEDVAAHAATFFTDGFETSSTTLAHALYELASNPDVLDRLRDELDRALEANKGVLNYEMMQELTYLDMVIAETMRKHPPATFMSRVCTKSYELATPGGGSYLVEVGTPVIVPIMALHMDPVHYPQPEVFDPQRFNEENKASRHKFAYLPFGEGPRICLGIRFALTQTKAGLAAIVSNFDFQLNKRTEVPLVPDPKSFILSAKGGIWLDFTKRSK